jgi:hypothetical protein
MVAQRSQRLYTLYPASSVLLYDGLTVVHFLLGGVAILLAYPVAVGAPLAGACVSHCACPA